MSAASNQFDLLIPLAAIRRSVEFQQNEQQAASKWVEFRLTVGAIVVQPNHVGSRIKGAGVAKVSRVQMARLSAPLRAGVRQLLSGAQVNAARCSPGCSSGVGVALSCLSLCVDRGDRRAKAATARRLSAGDWRLETGEGRLEIRDFTKLATQLAANSKYASTQISLLAAP